MDEKLATPGTSTKNSACGCVSVSKTLKLISWNIDGRDNRNVKHRTEAVCRIIKTEDADIVFLQEVIPATATQIETTLPEYKCLFSKNAAGYFTAILLKEESVSYVKHSIENFPGSRMGRNLLITQVKVAGEKLVLITTHLESTQAPECVTQRVNQLKTVFEVVSVFPEQMTVVFGGDLNIQDKEIALARGIPKNVSDLWVACGSPQECAYTWDTTENDNCNFKHIQKKPKRRYDRLYMRGGAECRIVPTEFRFIGKERLSPFRNFPSDHWGLLCAFDISE